ncbi:MAG: hypothetical protein RL693_666 [Verrucomicrobiota bacterium]|jgi:chromosome segregation ATPase
MRPISQPILILLIAILCSLCVWQWWRESSLREITVQQRNEISKLSTERQEMESRIKEADMEILRLTSSVTDLRTNSVSKEALDELAQNRKRLQETLEKQSLLLRQQNESIVTQNEALTTQNIAIKQANETIKKLVEDRDKLVKQINEVTLRYNELAKAPKSAPAP